MRAIPLDVLVHFSIPNYTNPPTTGHYALIVDIVFLTIALICVALRVYSRVRSVRSLGWDDFLIMVGMALSIGLSITSILATYEYKCNRHLWDFPPELWAANLKFAIVLKVLFTTAGAVVRQSLLAFYLRLIGDADLRREKTMIYIVTVFNVTLCLAGDFVSVFNCIPISAYWHYPSEDYGSCLDESASVLALSAITMGLDIVVFLLPLPIINYLHMPLRRKIGVGILLSLGLITVSAAGLRTYYTWKAFIQTWDITWWAAPLWVCGTVEINLAIMCACAPAIRTLLTDKAPWAMKPFRVVGNWFPRFINPNYRSTGSAKDGTATAVGTDPRSAADPSGHGGGKANASYIQRIEEKQAYLDSHSSAGDPSAHSNASSREDVAEYDYPYNPPDRKAASTPNQVNRGGRRPSSQVLGIYQIAQIPRGDQPRDVIPTNQTSSLFTEEPAELEAFREPSWGQTRELHGSDNIGSQYQTRRLAELARSVERHPSPLQSNAVYRPQPSSGGNPLEYFALHANCTNGSAPDHGDRAQYGGHESLQTETSRTRDRILHNDWAARQEAKMRAVQQMHIEPSHASVPSSPAAAPNQYLYNSMQESPMEYSYSKEIRNGNAAQRAPLSRYNSSREVAHTPHIIDSIYECETGEEEEDDYLNRSQYGRR